MKIRIETVYDKQQNLTHILVWRGMQLLERTTEEREIDEYEMDGIKEELEKKHNPKKRRKK